MKISVPVILGQKPFLNFLSDFLKAHARIRIDLSITNLFLDLVAENIDVAIRFGELEDSSVVATRIGKSIRYVVATPEYLKGRKLPVEPAEVATTAVIGDQYYLLTAIIAKCLLSRAKLRSSSV